MDNTETAQWENEKDSHHLTIGIIFWYTIMGYSACLLSDSLRDALSDSVLGEGENKGCVSQVA